MTQRDLKKILLVEDAVDIQMVARISLERVGGFTVEVCGSGAEAIEKAPSFAPDLILLDIMMPGMDGVATFKKLRAIPALSKIPVIFMTAKGEEDVRKTEGLGAFPVLFKPFEPIALPDEVRALWRKAFEATG